jgi:hypothetical protein
MLLRVVLTVYIGWAEVRVQCERQEMNTEYLWDFPDMAIWKAEKDLER